ncbi:MAG: hypothetical protein IJ849_13115 [Selenomonadaceae bacterium]|nr:hypothetical protein [Selenomonadaceae bacterium]
MLSVEGRRRITTTKNWFRDMVTALSLTLALLPTFWVVAFLSAEAGINPAVAFSASVMVAALGIYLMGLSGRSLWAVAPDMTLMPWLIYGEIISRGRSCEGVLALALVAALVSMFLIFAAKKIISREYIPLFPPAIAAGITGGLGALLIWQGLIQARLITASSFNGIMLGNLAEPNPYDGLIGLAVTMALLLRGKEYALGAGALTVALISLWQGFWALPEKIWSLPTGIFSEAPQLDFADCLAGDLLGLLPALILAQLILPRLMWQVFPTERSPGTTARLNSCQLGLLGTSALGNLWGAFPLNISAVTAVREAVGSSSRRTALPTALLLLSLIFFQPLVVAMADFPAIITPVLVGAGYVVLNRSFTCWANFAPAERLTFMTALWLLPLSHSLPLTLGVAVLMQVGGSLLNLRRQPSPNESLAILLSVAYLLWYGF